MTTPQLSTPDFSLLTSAPILTPDAYYVSVSDRVEVFAGQILSIIAYDYQTLGIYAFLYNISTATGDVNDIREDMSIDFGTTPGARDIGTARIRLVPSGAVIFINEIAPAKLPLADGIYFSVKDEYIPHLVLPLGRESAVGTAYINTVTMYVDYDVSYTDQNQNFTPKANITRSATLKQSPNPAGWVDGYHTLSPSVYRTVTLSGALSFCIESSIVGYVWDVKDGTIIGGGTSTDATITVRFPVGYRIVRLTVTAANGKSASRILSIWTHDNTYLPLSRFAINSNHSADHRSVELEFFQQNTNEIIIHKGTGLCFWEDNFTTQYGQVDQYREQVSGWSPQEVTLFRKYQSRTTVTITGIAEWLDRYRAIPQRVSDPITRASQSWFEMEDITLDKLAFYMLENFSTANLISNLFLSGVTDTLKSLDITGQSLYDQVRYITQGNYSKVRCKSLNDIQLEASYQHMTAAQRAAVDPTMELTAAHWLDSDAPKLNSRNYDLVASILGAGGSFDGTTNTIYNSRAPGRTPGDSNSEQDAPGQNLPATSGQDALNQLTGAQLMILNNANDNVPLNVLQNLDCVEVGDLITLTSSDSDSGVVMDHDPFLIKEINISYDDRYSGRGKKVGFALEKVIGPATSDDAQWVDVPVDTTTPADYTPPADITPAPPPATPPVTMPPYNGIDIVPTRLIIADKSAASVHVALNFIPALGTLVYTDASTGLTGYNIWLSADPYNYKRYFALQSTGLYKNDDPFAGGSWTLVATNNTLFGDPSRIGKTVEMSINRRGFIAILSGNVFVHSFDYGATWTNTAIGGAATYITSLSGSLHNSNGFAISPYNNGAEGWVYCNILAVGFYKSVDWGNNWTLLNTYVGTGVNAFIGQPHIPYIRSDGSTPNINSGSQELYTGLELGNENGVLKSVDAAVTWAEIYYINASGNRWKFQQALTGWNMMTFTYDAKKMSFWGGTDPGSNFSWVRITDDELATYTSWIQGIVGDTRDGHVNRYPVHSGATLIWHRDLTTFAWTMDDGLNWVSASAPSGYGGVSNVQWDISTLIGS